MSPIPHAHLVLIEAFLGPDAVPVGDRGVEAVLGLPVGEAQPDRVYAAMQTRLAQIAAHPRAASPEADVVRLCVQAAATQLLAPPAPLLRPAAAPITPPPTAGPATAPVLIRPGSGATIPLAPEDPPPAPSAPQAAPPAPPRPLSPVARAATPPDHPPSDVDALRREAARLLATEGAITPAVIQRLASMAMARGLPALAVQNVLASLAGSAPGPIAASPPARSVAPAPPPTVTPPQPPQPPRASAAPATSPAAPPAPSRPARPQADAWLQQPTPQPSAHLRDDDEEEDPAQRLLRIALLVGGGVFLAALTLVIVGLFLIGGSAEPAPAPTPAPVAVAPAPAPEPAKPKPDPEYDLGAIPDAAAVVRLVRRAADVPSAPTGDTPPRAVAVERMEKSLPILAAWWTRLDAGQRVAAADAIVDLLFKISSDLVLTERVVAAVAAGAEPLLRPDVPFGPESVGPAAWSVGMLARLTRERELPAAVAMRVQRTVSQALGGARLPAQASFNAGAAMALRAMPLRIVQARAAATPATPANVAAATAPPRDTIPALERWYAAVAALFGDAPSDAALAEALVTEGLERLILAGPEPDQDKAAFEAIGFLAAKLRWRAGDASRARLLSWFEDRGVSAADLATVTSAIVSRSAAEGVDLTMVLSAGASPEQRAALRDAYALAWSLSPAAVGAGEGWARVARMELAVDDGVEPVAVLRGATVFARLNQAAFLRHAGDSAAAADVLRKHVAPIARGSSIPPVIVTLGNPHSGTDGDWALRFLAPDRSASAGPSRVERLRELNARAPDIGPIDADVLVEAALLGTGEARSTALRMLPLFSTSPNISLSMLRYLHRAPRSPALASAVAGVTNRAAGPWNGEPWPVLARRALVERALELLSADADTAEIDRASVALAEVYAAAAGLPTPASWPDPDSAGILARDAAAAFAAALRNTAIRLSPNDRAPRTLDEIDRRHAARLSVARGLPQQFAAEQAACAELLAFVTSAERPGAASDCRAVIDTLDSASREAGHVLIQIRAAEAAILRLWLLRTGEGLS